MNADLLTTLKRGDQRWADQHDHEPAPAEYVEHLANEVRPLLLEQPAAGELEQLRAELRQTRLELDRTRLVEEGRRRDLGRLVDAVNGEWHPAADPIAQVQRALDLVAAASDQLGARHDAGEHIHRYELDGAGRPGKCDCGKEFPTASQKSLAPERKGDAA